MRLRRLDLTRYGKFTDRSIDFGERTEGQPDLHIIWRPHPLLASTIIAMRPEYASIYVKLLQASGRSRRIHLDLSQDHAPAMIAADACLSFSSTSIPLLFSTLGKPVLRLDGEAGGAGRSPHTPVFGEFETHPWICSEAESGTNPSAFLEYVRLRAHDQAQQILALEPAVGPTDGLNGQRIHEAILGMLGKNQ